ncbi:MAG: sulfur carrier protein ThiS [Planctomycetota bacterium]|jgi:thiamine biosynthesis protein ThiS
MFKLILNGDELEYSPENKPETLKDLAEKSGLKPESLIAEVNGKIVKNTEFHTYHIEPGSIIELVQFVGGG